MDIMGIIYQKYSAWSILSAHWQVGIVAMLSALFATPVFRLIAYKAKLVDKPDDLLKPHKRPIAYLGGLGICTGLLAGLVTYLCTMPEGAAHWQGLRDSLGQGDWAALLANPIWNLCAILLASLLITLVGLADDIRDITPNQKILGQLTVAALLLIGGIGTHMIRVLSAPVGVILPEWLTVLLSAMVCVVLVVATCNAANLLDGLDGLCGGVTAIISLGFLALAVWLASWARFPGMDELRVALCLAMAGSRLGFLPYNIPPASIFMGDAGSMLLGFFVATMMALFCQEGNLRWLLAACVVFALPIIDTSLAVVRRLRMGVNIFAGDRSHLYDQLVDRGMTIKQVVTLFYICALVTASLAVALAITLRTRYALIIYAAGFLSIWTVLWMLGMITPPGRKPAGEENAKTANRDN
jgi:UDP-GlcNAc:undecaprenyl-phosphate GlcNAc-1-phosphate transferase